MSVPKDDHGRCSPGLLTWHSCTSTPSAMQDTLSYTREETKKAKHFVWTLPLPLALSNAINEVVSKKFQGFFTPASKQRLDYLQDDGAVKLGCAKHKVWLMATGASGTYFKCPIYDAGWREKGKGFLGEEGCVKMLHQQVVGQLQEPKIIKDLEKAAKAAPPRAPAITFKGSAKGDTKKRSRADAPAAPKAKKARRKEAEDEEEEEEEEASPKPGKVRSTPRGHGTGEVEAPCQPVPFLALWLGQGGQAQGQDGKRRWSPYLVACWPYLMEPTSPFLLPSITGEEPQAPRVGHLSLLKESVVV
jgi:hypothetical protein